MTPKQRSAWSGWVEDRIVRYLWTPRHGQGESPRALSWMTIVVVAAVMLGIGVGAYVGFRGGRAEPPPTNSVLPALSVSVPSEYPSPSSAPASSAPPSPSPSPSK